MMQPSAPPASPQTTARSKVARADRWFRGLATGFGLSILGLMALLTLALFIDAWPAIRHFGLRFLTSSEWNYVDQFGALPYIWGTIYSSLLGLLLSLPVSLGVAIFLAEIASGSLRTPLSFLVEMLAAIPSVVYGLWGIFVLVPIVRTVETWLNAHFGFIPLFAGAPFGVDMFSAAVVLAIMITPTIASVSRDVLLAVPASQREAALALGATRWESIKVAFSNAWSGIVGAIILGLGRALGETMAVTMVIGNTATISFSLLSPAYSMAAVLANEFSEAVNELHIASLVTIGLLLFAVTFILNSLSRWLVGRLTARATGEGSVRV